MFKPELAEAITTLQSKVNGIESFEDAVAMCGLDERAFMALMQAKCPAIHTALTEFAANDDLDLFVQFCIFFKIAVGMGMVIESKIKAVK